MKYNSIGILRQPIQYLVLIAITMISIHVQAAPDDLQPALSFTVTRSDDRNNATCVPGDCSLREAVNAANASATDDTIDFAVGLTTVTLTNEIVINNAGTLTISGPGANILTIDGGAGTNRIFSANQATATISGLTLTGGNGGGAIHSGDGGAIFAQNCSLILDGILVMGNTANGPDGGGGVDFSGGANRIINSTISANTADFGGGVFMGGDTLSVVNSTISGNLATHSGGGFYVNCFACYATTFRDVTITSNSAQEGGGIYEEAYGYTLNLGNTILAGNVAFQGLGHGPENYSECDTSCGAIISAGGNLVGDSPGDSTHTGAIAIVYQPTDIRDTDPLLGALQNNGGTTPTHALMAGSPVIDRGVNALAVDPFNGNPLAFDQRGTGFARIRDGNGDSTATVDIGAFEVQPVNVANLEELYSAVNDPQNAGSQINIAPGVYMLSVNDPNGADRPNSGRLEFQENMSLQGVAGDRGAVVIDAINLPVSSYNNAPPLALTAAIRMGRGTNALEWLTVRNAINGISNIDTDLVLPGTAYIRVAHVASSNSQRGIDVRNIGPAMAGRVIEAQIVDNDVYNNRIGLFGEALRFVNNGGATGGVISATLSDNRSYNNYLGLIVEDNGSSLANISVVSSGDRFFENGLGALVGGGLSAPSLANGNTVNFMATGTSFENNNGVNNFDHGGLIVIGGENTFIPNGTSDNTVNVVLRGCRSVNNQLSDLTAIGARSNPASIGCPGTNNRVKVRLYSTLIPNLVAIDSIPDCPGGMNFATVSRPSFDFDDDGTADISVFRPSNGAWYLQPSTGGFFGTFFGVSTDKITPADFEGDGKTDIAVYRASSGDWFILKSSTETITHFNFGIAEDLPTPADYDGDGKADISVYRPSLGTWYRVNSSNGSFIAMQFGVSGDKPTIGDYDGDGKADIAVFRPSNDTWYRLNSSNGSLVAIGFGISTDLITPADFDGDGKTDIAVYRSSSGTWYWLNSSNGAFNAAQFGVVEDLPTAADFDGDGKADISVFRPSNGTWYRLNSSNGGFVAVQFGTNGDRPTPSAFRF